MDDIAKPSPAPTSERDGLSVRLAGGGLILVISALIALFAFGDVAWLTWPALIAGGAGLLAFFAGYLVAVKRNNDKFADLWHLIWVIPAIVKLAHEAWQLLTGN